MFIALLGPSSPLMGWCIEAAKHLMQAQFGACQHVNANTVDELKAAFAAGRDAHVLLCSQAPDPQIVRLIVEGGVRNVVVLEHPVALGHHYQHGQAMDAKTAIAAVSISFCALHDLILDPNTHLIHRHRNNGVEQLVRDLALGFGFALRLAQLDQIIKAMPQPPPPDPSSATDREIVTTALRSYESLLDRRPTSQLIWPAEVFMQLDAPTGLLQGPIDLTGHARIIVFGPYLHIPPGSWSATPQFEIGENESGNKLKIDMYAGGATTKVLAECEWPMPTRGAFSTSLAFEIDEPKSPLEMRIYCQEGAIEGWFKLHGVAINLA